MNKQPGRRGRTKEPIVLRMQPSVGTPPVDAVLALIKAQLGKKLDAATAQRDVVGKEDDPGER